MPPKIIAPGQPSIQLVDPAAGQVQQQAGRLQQYGAQLMQELHQGAQRLLEQLQTAVDQAFTRMPQRKAAGGGEPMAAPRRYLIDGVLRAPGPDQVFIDVQIAVGVTATATNPATATFRAPFHLVADRITVYSSDSAGLTSARLSWRLDNGAQTAFRSADGSSTIIRPPLDAIFTSGTADCPAVDVQMVARKDRDVVFEAEPLAGVAPFTLDLTLVCRELVPC